MSNTPWLLSAAEVWHARWAFGSPSSKFSSLTTLTSQILPPIQYTTVHGTTMINESLEQKQMPTKYKWGPSWDLEVRWAYLSSQGYSSLGWLTLGIRSPDRRTGSHRRNRGERSSLCFDEALSLDFLRQWFRMGVWLRLRAVWGTAIQDEGQREIDKRNRVVLSHSASCWSRF